MRPRPGPLRMLRTQLVGLVDAPDLLRCPGGQDLNQAALVCASPLHGKPRREGFMSQLPKSGPTERRSITRNLQRIKTTHRVLATGFSHFLFSCSNSNASTVITASKPTFMGCFYVWVTVPGEAQFLLARGWLFPRSGCAFPSRQNLQAKAVMSLFFKNHPWD